MSGYVANGPDGWSTTATGCELLERQRVDARCWLQGTSHNAPPL